MFSRDDVLVRIGADTRGLESGFRRTQTETASLGKSFSKLGGIIAGIGAAGAIRGILSLTNAAREQELAQRTLGIIVENTGASWERYEGRVLAATAAIQAKTNFGDEEQLRILGQLVPIIGDVDKAMAALPLVLDAATASGRNASSVAVTLGRALAGQSNVAESIGVTFDKTAGFSERLAVGLDKVGGAAAANVDPTEQLSNTMGDFKERIGKEFKPAIDDLSASLSNLLSIGGGREEEEAARRWPTTFELIAKGAKVFSQGLKDIAEAPSSAEAWAEIRERDIASLEELTAELAASTTGVVKLSMAQQALADRTEPLIVTLKGGAEAQRDWALSGDLMIAASESMAEWQGILADSLRETAEEFPVLNTLADTFTARLAAFSATRGFGVIDTLGALEMGWSAQADAIRATVKAAEDYHRFVEQEYRAVGTVMQPFGPAPLSAGASRLAQITAQSIAFNVSQGALTRAEAAQRITNIASGAIVINGYTGDPAQLAAEIGRLVFDESRTM